MSRFRRQQSSVPGLNTAALPDLIFTVLFFFMIVTHMRDVELKVHYQVPQGSQVEKVTRKGSVIQVYIGTAAVSAAAPTASQAPQKPLIQIGNRIVSLDGIGQAIAEERRRMSAEDRQHMTVSIKADRDVDMGLITDVKQALRKAGALRINYSATKRAD